VFLTRPPRASVRRPRASDLHVLRTPPAFVLSQDQTRHQKWNTSPNGIRVLRAYGSVMLYQGFTLPRACARETARLSAFAPSYATCLYAAVCFPLFNCQGAACPTNRFTERAMMTPRFSAHPLRLPNLDGTVKRACEISRLLGKCRGHSQRRFRGGLLNIPSALLRVKRRTRNIPTTCAGKSWKPGSIPFAHR